MTDIFGAQSKPSNKAVEAFAQMAEQASVRAQHPVTYVTSASLGEAFTAAKFRLENGLTVVFMQDVRAPVFAFQTWFRVGSKHEDPERTGLAHLFEHLMFKGTHTYPTGTFDEEMERRGSQTNAATWVDWTHYTEALAARGDNLETVVKFECDRMRNLILDQETFASELEVVKNERRMTVDNSIAGLLSERLYNLAFTKHPYRWPTIGSMAHLEATTLEDLRAFYQANYAPNNAVVVIVGDLDGADTLTMLATHYGPIAAHPVTTRERPTEPAQTEERIERIERPMLAGQLVMGYHMPAQHDDDYPACEMLCEMLAGGESSRLYRRLVIHDSLATDVSAATCPFSEPGLFEFSLTLRHDAKPDTAMAAIQSELERMAKEGPSEEEREKAVNQLELSFWERFHDAESVAEALGHHETNDGDFSKGFGGPQGWQQVSASRLRQLTERLFRVENRTTVIAMPPSNPTAN